MRELAAILKGWRASAGQPMVLATVVETLGSTYRHAGARMLITPEGWIAGSVSGGCLESDLIESAWRRTEDGPAIVTYDTSSESDLVWGLGLGCNGVVKVLLERIDRDDPGLASMEACVRGHQAFQIATTIGVGPRLGHRDVRASGEEPGHLFVNSSRLVNVEGDKVLIEEIVPPPHLVVFGSGHDVLPLVRFAKLLGWRTTVADSKSGTVDRFSEADEVIAFPPSEIVEKAKVDARTFAVVMTHNYLMDLQILDGLLQSPAPYIGLLGPSARRARLLQEVEARVDSDRIHGPAGLDLGAEGPEEIALAIIAEIQAVVGGRAGGFLGSRPAFSEVQKCAHLA